MKKYNDEYGFINTEVSEDYRIIASMMLEEEYNTYMSKWGYLPKRYRLVVDNGCGLAYTDKFETIEELRKAVNRIQFITDEEKEFLLRLEA